MIHQNTHPLPRPAAPPSAEVTTTVEVAPGTLCKIEPLPLACSGAAVPLHNQYHRNAMLSTAQAACWIVLAGAELKRSKKLVGHGGWEKWVEENCEYTERTARRYMELAECVKDKALREASKRTPVSDLEGKTAAVRFLEMLECPAGLLTGEQQLALLKSVHHLTDGETVQQLYLDFGIIKRGGLRRGGDTSHAPKLSPEERHAQIIANLRADSMGLFESTLALGPAWRVLNDAEIETGAEVLEEKAAELRAWLKTPKSQRPVLDATRALISAKPQP